MSPIPGPSSAPDTAAATAWAEYKAAKQSTEEIQYLESIGDVDLKIEELLKKFPPKA